MNSFPLPAKASFDDCDFHFNERAVFLWFPPGRFEALTAADRYIVTVGALDKDDSFQGMTMYEFLRRDWPEIVRLIGLSETEWEAAVYSAWLTYDVSPAVPECFKTKKGGAA